MLWGLGFYPTPILYYKKKTFMLLLNIVISISTLLMINSFLKGKFDKITSPSKKSLLIDTSPFWLYCLYMLFGIFMFPFYKKIRKYKRIKYLESEKKYYENMKDLFIEVGIMGKKTESLFNDKYYDVLRELKLLKITRKTHKRKLLK